MNKTPSLYQVSKIAGLFLVFFILFSHKAKSQNVTYFPFNSMFSVSTNPNNVFWMDLRFQTNSYFSTLASEISPQVNVKSTDRADFYVGGGVRVNYGNLFNSYNPLEGYFLNGGVRARPFDKFKAIHVVFEISPYAVRQMDAGLFRANLGIGYNFNQWK